MASNKIATLHIDVIQPNEDDDVDHLGELKRQLFRELSDLEVEDLEIISTDSVPEGAKSIEGLASEILVAVVVAQAPNVINLITNWLKRSPGRKLKVASTYAGKEVEIILSTEDLKTEEINRLIQSLSDSTS